MDGWMDGCVCMCVAEWLRSSALGLITPGLRSQNNVLASIITYEFIVIISTACEEKYECNKIENNGGGGNKPHSYASEILSCPRIKVAVQCTANYYISTEVHQNSSTCQHTFDLISSRVQRSHNPYYHFEERVIVWLHKMSSLETGQRAKQTDGRCPVDDGRGGGKESSHNLQKKRKEGDIKIGEQCTVEKLLFSVN